MLRHKKSVKRSPVRSQEVPMQKSVYKSYDDLPLFLNAEMVAKALES